MKLRLQALAVIATLLLPACTTGEVKSRHPLSSAYTAFPDPRLEGLWRVKDGSSYTYITFGSHDYRGRNLLLSFGNVNIPHSGQTGFSDAADIFITRTAGHNYLNVNNDSDRLAGGTVLPDNDPKAYSFTEYHFTKGGALVLIPLQGDGFAKAVDKKKLRGTNTNGFGGTDTLLNDSGDHILSFIESSKPADIYLPPQKFTKIGGP